MKGIVKVIGIISAIIAIVLCWCYTLDKAQYNALREQHIKEQYAENIRVLNDSIQLLKNNIEKYQSDIDSLNLERTKVREVVKTIIQHNEEIDLLIVNGSVDDNVRFLTEFLSKDYGFGEGHNSGNNKASVDTDKPLTE